MKLKNVVDEYGNNVTIDEETRKIYDYKNAERKIVYNAQIVEDGVPQPFFTNYIEEGTVDCIEDRLRKWNNRMLYLYASRVGFNASKNDPDRAVYKEFVERVKEKQDLIFDENGDFRKDEVMYPELFSDL